MAEHSISRLKIILEQLQDALKVRPPGYGIPITHCENMMKEAHTIWNEVARANGAILVRSAMQ